MSQKNPPGYPLPSGTLGSDEIVCQLVYLPDRDEYWQALYGALSYMATWRAWERDIDKRGKDAADDWRAALELTTECWRMACLDELTETVENILLHLQGTKQCCDDNVTYLPTDEVTTDIVPNEGDAPDYYGETAVADWDEWNEYLCYAAHFYVDYLTGVGNNLYEAVRNNSIGIGVVAAALTLLGASGIGLPVAFATAAAIVGGLALLATISTFIDSAEDIEAARTEIVCAILNDGDLAGVVETALGSNLAWDLFYSEILYDQAKSIMYEGGYDGEFLPAEKKDDCVSCEDPPYFAFYFDEDLDGWDDNDEHSWNAGGWLEALTQAGGVWIFKWNFTVAELEAKFSITRPIYISRVVWRMRFNAHGESPPVRMQTYIAFQRYGGTSNTTVLNSNTEGWDSWEEYETIFDPAIRLADQTAVDTITHAIYSYSVAVDDERVDIEWIKFYYEE